MLRPSVLSPEHGLHRIKASTSDLSWRFPVKSCKCETSCFCLVTCSSDLMERSFWTLVILRGGLKSHLNSQLRPTTAIRMDFAYPLSVYTPLLNPWIRGDGVGYYAYARAPLIEHDLDFTHDYQSANESFREARCDENGQPKKEFRTRTGHLDNHFTVGPAMLWSPFLLVAHGGVLLARHWVPQCRRWFFAPYRYAMAFGTGLYAFLGLLAFLSAGQQICGILWSFIATIAIWWASSSPGLHVLQSILVACHSAFVVALFLWYWDATREDAKPGAVAASGSDRWAHARCILCESDGCHCPCC